MNSTGHQHEEVEVKEAQNVAREILLRGYEQGRLSLGEQKDNDLLLVSNRNATHVGNVSHNKASFLQPRISSAIEGRKKTIWMKSKNTKLKRVMVSRDKSQWKIHESLSKRQF